jgi:hypothetical protein
MNIIEVDLISDFAALRRRAATNARRFVQLPVRAETPQCSEVRSKRIAAIKSCAYYRWAYRGGGTGGELEDWLAAERDVDLLFERRDQLVREAAYYRWKRFGRRDGHALEDWLAAERQIDAWLGL